jgi:hypothetical protein
MVEPSELSCQQLDELIDKIARKLGITFSSEPVKVS